MIYDKVLLDSIELEKAGVDYRCPDLDREILQELFKEVSEHTGVTVQYLAEIDAFNIPGSGEIMARYITKFTSESVKSFFLPQIVSDKIKNCDKLILQLYLSFRTTNEYAPMPDFLSPAHIYVRYDNAFKKLKPKRLKKELMELAYNPIDVIYLPFTMRMLASWKVPELKELLIFYLNDMNITANSLGINLNKEGFFPSLDYVRRELKFTAIEGLKYYPSLEVMEMIGQYVESKDLDIKAIAKKSLKVISNKIDQKSVGL